MTDDRDVRHLLDKEQLVADAHALARLSEMPEWLVLVRLIHEHSERIMRELCTRGLDPTHTEALRVELQALEWLRARPEALAAAVKEYDDLERMRTVPVTPEIVSGPEPFETWQRRREESR